MKWNWHLVINDLPRMEKFPPSRYFFFKNNIRKFGNKEWIGSPHPLVRRRSVFKNIHITHAVLYISPSLMTRTIAASFSVSRRDRRRCHPSFHFSSSCRFIRQLILIVTLALFSAPSWYRWYVSIWFI